MTKEYTTDYDCEQMQYEDGAMRSAQTDKGRFDLIPTNILFRVAKVYQRGGDKHGDRNWEKGFPICRAIDSAIRHLLQFQLKVKDEDHAAQAIWNIFAAAHLEEVVKKGVLDPKWDDRPTYERPKEEHTLKVEDIKAADIKVEESANSQAIRVLHIPTGHAVTAFRVESKVENYEAALKELRDFLEYTKDYRVIQEPGVRYEVVDTVRAKAMADMLDEQNEKAFKAMNNPKPLKRISISKDVLYDTGRRFKVSGDSKPTLKESDFNFGDDEVVDDLPKHPKREWELELDKREDDK